MADVAGTTHHILLEDEGYQIVPATYQRALANPLAAKIGAGEQTYSDLSEWSAWAQTDWRGGMLEERVESPDRYYWGYGVESRVKGQLTLGPEIHGPYSVGAAPVAFAAFSEEWYVAAGTALKKWVESSSSWSNVKTDFSATLTDLCVFDGYLFCCQGEAHNAFKMSTAEAFTDVGVPIRLATVFEGYLYRVDNGTEVYYTNAHDGAWIDDAILVGREDYDINDIVGFDGDTWVGKPDGLWYIRVDMAWQTMNWLTMLDDDNACTLVEYNGSLYIPVGPGLVRYTGQLAETVGVNKEAGLPELYNGPVSDMVTLQGGLYAAIDAGSTASHKSSVVCWTERGWHPILLATSAQNRILALGYESLHSPGRLWFGQGTYAGYVSIPDMTDNPTKQTGWSYTSAGLLQTGWFSGGLMEVEKDFESVLVVADNLTANVNVVVAYEIDHFGSWTTLSTASVSPEQEITFPTSSFSNKTTAAGCTTTSIVCTADVTGDVSAGEWLRVSNEIRQVKSVATTTITLHRALSAAPAAGVTVYPARAAGREIRLQFTLNTNSSSTSPVITAIRLKSMAMVRDSWQWQMHVRAADNLEGVDRLRESRTAAQIADDLMALAKRINPIAFTDIHGDSYTVKIVSAQEIVDKYNPGGMEGRWGLVLLEV